MGVSEGIVWARRSETSRVSGGLWVAVVLAMVDATVLG